MWNFWTSSRSASCLCGLAVGTLLLGGCAPPQSETEQKESSAVDRFSDKRSLLKAKLEQLEHQDDAVTASRQKTLADLRKSMKKRGGHAPAPPSSNSPSPILYGRSLPRTAKPKRQPQRDPSEPRVALEGLPGGRSATVDEHGALFIVDTVAGNVNGAESLARSFSSLLHDERFQLFHNVSKLCDATQLTVDQIVFMDIETTGLSSSPLFLIGIMVWEDNDFVVRQFFARDYSEERAVVASFLDACIGKKLLVTFNGKSFDVPYIRARAMVNGLPFDLPLAHMDLLHVGRRIWRDKLPDCKLQTLERHICGRTRVGDLPGGEIPAAYHDYVRTDDAWQMTGALEHNCLDLITLADIMTRFP